MPAAVADTAWAAAQVELAEPADSAAEGKVDTEAAAGVPAVAEDTAVAAEAPQPLGSELPHKPDRRQRYQLLDFRIFCKVPSKAPQRECVLNGNANLMGALLASQLQSGFRTALEAASA